jgi:hypothetical protein
MSNQILSDIKNDIKNDINRTYSEMNNDIKGVYSKINNDIKKGYTDIKSFKKSIYKEIYTSDVIKFIRGFENHIYDKLNSIPKNTFWYDMYLIIRFVIIVCFNLLVIIIPLVIALSIYSYFQHSESWLARTTRYLLHRLIETPYYLKPPG